MRPPSLLASASATRTLQPLIGGRPIPHLDDPASRDLAELERIALGYGEAHAAETGYPAPRLAVAAFDALVHFAERVDRPAPPGRWTSRPPAPGVTEARTRLSGHFGVEPLRESSPSPKTVPF